MAELTRGRFDSGLVTWLKFCNGYWAIAVALVFFSSRLVVFFRLGSVLDWLLVTGCSRPKTVVHTGELRATKLSFVDVGVC